MKEFLNRVILDNPVKSYLWVIGIIFIVFLFKHYLSRYIAGLLFRVVKKVARGVDKTTFVNLVVAPLKTFLLILITLIAFEKLHFPTTPFSILGVEIEPNFTIYKVSFRTIVDSISIIVLIISFIWLLRRVIDFIAMILEQKANLTADQTDNQLIVFFKDFFKVVLVINGVLLCLKFGFHLNIGSFLTGLSIASAAFALAFRESLENFIASFIIFFDKPFTTGDLVKVQNITGTVEKIGLRSTRIRTDQKTFLTMPNKQMVDSIMDNLTLRTQRRGFIQLDLQANTPADAVQQLLLSIEAILKRKKEFVENYSVFLSDITRTGYIVQVEFFTPTVPIAQFNAGRQEINLAIIQQLKELGIKLSVKDPE
ncbi:MAG: mechanosensitive ion channel family protein [Chitinophagaceae bacterium]|uniref:mechanosensitive ion channel family protein n=1 Tax=unclassified Paraflavitalea TaxID=2798305 RepID=UPI003D354FC4|nr:mechanosensitive ion channel family protein [Chitinophagaceae bacterium]